MPRFACGHRSATTPRRGESRMRGNEPYFGFPCQICMSNDSREAAESVADSWANEIEDLQRRIDQIMEQLDRHPGDQYLEEELDRTEDELDEAESSRNEQVQHIWTQYYRLWRESPRYH
ncbi:hypothetical protein ACLMJK_000115 [Lecanora helva]